MTGSELVLVSPTAEPPKRKVRRPGVADASAGVLGAVGIGGSTAALMADWPWWISAPAAGIGVLSGVLALGGRTAELWHRIMRIRIRNETDKAVVAEIRQISDHLKDRSLPEKKRQRLIKELAYLYRLLGERS